MLDGLDLGAENVDYPATIVGDALHGAVGSFGVVPPARAFSRGGRSAHPEWESPRLPSR